MSFTVEVLGVKVFSDDGGERERGLANNIGCGESARSFENIFSTLTAKEQFDNRLQFYNQMNKAVAAVKLVVLERNGERSLRTKQRVDGKS